MNIKWNAAAGIFAVIVIFGALDSYMSYVGTVYERLLESAIALIYPFVLIGLVSRCTGFVFFREGQLQVLALVTLILGLLQALLPFVIYADQSVDIARIITTGIQALLVCLTSTVLFKRN